MSDRPPAAEPATASSVRRRRFIPPWIQARLDWEADQRQKAELLGIHRNEAQERRDLDTVLERFYEKLAEQQHVEPPF
jgi:hypothetical protein